VRIDDTEQLEPRVRRQIDATLLAFGWDVQDRAAMILAATPAKHTYAFFHKNMVSDYTHTHAVRDLCRTADEVLQHLSGLPGAKVTLTVEVRVSAPEGVPQHVARLSGPCPS
jgi:type I site-specific restriction endonuclease